MPHTDQAWQVEQERVANGLLLMPPGMPRSVLCAAGTSCCAHLLLELLFFLLTAPPPFFLKTVTVADLEVPI